MDPKTALQTLQSALDELVSTKVGRRAFIQATPLLLASCATGSKSRFREGDNSGQETALTPQDEERMTQETLPEIRKDYPALEDAELQAYVRQIGSRLVTANNLTGHPYRYTFTVVQSQTVNAFALPAGTIFVTAPLISLAETEAELAGVIGHEIGHVKARHAAERIDAAEKQKSKGILYGVGGGLLGGAAGFGLGKLLCPPRDKKCLQTAAAAGAVVGVGGALLIQKYKFMANSREDEMEADRIGFRTSVQAGYSKDHVGTFYAKLLKMEEDRGRTGTPLLASLNDAMSTHPPSRERVSQMTELARSQRAVPKAIVSTQAFERARKRAEQKAQKS